MLSGNNGILKRAGDAKEYTTIENEKEIISLAVTSLKSDKIPTNNDEINSEELQNEILKYGYSTRVTGNSTFKVTFLNTNHSYKIDINGNIRFEELINYESDNSNIKDIKIAIDNEDYYYTYILKENGNLYKYRCTEERGTVNLNDIEFIDSNVQECKGKYFLKNDKNLYDEQGNIIGENVKEFEGENFLTYDNTLYLIQNTSSVKVADNVKKFLDFYYLTNNNELYTYIYINNSQMDINKLLENVKDIENQSSIITYSNEAYRIIYDDNNDRYDVEKTNENVIQIGSTYYLTTDNKLKNKSNASFNVDNVTTFEEVFMGGTRYCIYKLQNNKEYFIRGSASAQEIPQYTKFEKGYYIAEDNNLYCISSGDFVLKENVVDFEILNSGSGNYWCLVSDGTIYYDLMTRYY